MRFTALSCLVTVALAGCMATGGGVSNTADDKSAATTPVAAAKPAAPAVPPGMNAKGEVVDSRNVQMGHGQKVKGINDWEGEITGKPAKNSKFTQLKIGMSMRQVTNQIGTPSDEGAYMTGKAWIPFYFGSDRHRYETVYKGHGRLIFAGGAGLGAGSLGGNLIWIIHNPNESDTR